MNERSAMTVDTCNRPTGPERGASGLSAARAWRFVGHESRIPAPGDFVTTRMGRAPVIVCRDRAGRIRVFLNACRHREVTLCRVDAGNATAFACPHHGWRFGLDGALEGVPRQDALYPGMDRADWSLVEVAGLALDRGAIWATWDPPRTGPARTGPARDRNELPAKTPAEIQAQIQGRKSTVCFKG